MIKIGDVEYTVKNVDTGKFRKDSYFLVADLYKALETHKDNPMKGYYEFLFPEVEGEVVPRFKSLFEMFLEGDLSGINYSMDKENCDKLVEVAIQLLNFFLLKTTN